MNTLHPFQDESTSLTLDGMTIENRLDQVALYGSLRITRDQAGLAHARALHALLQDIVATLEAEDLPARLPAPAAARTSNPFA